MITTDDIRSKVYIIRGQQVMLDKDLAEIYGYDVKRLNEQVKRNINRFPEDFMFQLKASEITDSLKSQFATLNISENKRGIHIKKMPFAFTEQGIYMLAIVLRGELAEKQNIFIMRTFREMRHYIKQNQQFVTKSEMPLYCETESQIFVHVGVDEEAAGENWMWGTSDSILLGKFPATKGKFYKTIIAGHVGTGSRDLADNRDYHDVFYDGESHYYIDGSVYKGGKLLLLAYDEEKGKYYQVENNRMIPVRPFDKY